MQIQTQRHSLKNVERRERRERRRPECNVVPWIGHGNRKKDTSGKTDESE